MTRTSDKLAAMWASHALKLFRGQARSAYLRIWFVRDTGEIWNTIDANLRFAATMAVLALAFAIATLVRVLA